jgi:dihydropteroate synthase type 2
VIGPPIILGIVNITEDSFSDGGRFLAADTAIAHAKALIASGASIIDAGGAASNPDAKPVAPETEIARLAPLVEALTRERIAVSVDSFSLPVQRWALERNVDFLNDIRGFPDPALYADLAAATRTRLIVMHAVRGVGQAERVVVEPGGIVERVLRFFDSRVSALEKAGIGRRRLVLDPGMGFFLGSQPEASFAMLRQIGRLKQAFGLPVLVSVSRKSFLRRITGRSAAECGPATLAAELFAVEQGADYIRTHDPAALADGLAVRRALLGSKSAARRTRPERGRMR